jgi:adenylate cyclase
VPRAPQHKVVLFVDICDSTQLYETLGDEVASRRVGGCLEALGKRVDEAGGRVVQRIGDELMCLFAGPEGALECARGMQEYIVRKAVRTKPVMAIRIGCHFGPVLEKAADLFGDSVNVAARAAEMAKAGQVLTTEATVSQLSGPLRERVRALGRFPLKGKREDIHIFELVWQDDESTMLGTLPDVPLPAEQGTRLLLRYRGSELALDGRARMALSVGRDPHCDLIISDPKASRRHARIESRRGKFVLVDQSVNGTYVQIGAEQIVLLREELILYSHGSISFGHRADSTGAAVVDFACQ